MPFIIRFSGPSNSGKTSWILQLIEQIAATGKRVGTIKHAHHTLETPERDGHHLGSIAPNITIGPNRTIIDWPHLDSKPTLTQVVEQMYSDFDVVVIEGWREYDLPTILTAVPPDNWTLPNTIIACTPNVPKTWRPQVNRWGLLDITKHILDTINGES